MYEIKRANRLSRAPLHVVTDRASLFTDERMSGLPIRAKYKHFKTILSLFLTILQLIQISCTQCMLMWRRLLVHHSPAVLQ